MAEFFENAADLADLLGVGGGELAAANEERVFKAGEKKPEPVREKSYDKEEPPYRQRRQFN